MLRPQYRAYLAAFLMDAAVMVVFATTPFFVFNQVGGDEAVAGMVGALQMAAYAFSCLATSRLVEQTRNGLRWALLGAFLFIFFSCLMPLYPTMLACAVLSFLACSALGLVWPALLSWIGGEPNAALRAKHMSYFTIAAGCGFALSPLLGGPLYDLDYRFPFVAVFALGVAIITLIGTLPNEKDHYAASNRDEDETESPETLKRDQGTNLLVAWCAVFVANMLVGATRSVYPKRVVDLLDSGDLRILFESEPGALLAQGPATTFSWLVSALWVATAFCFFLMGRKHHWHHRMGLVLGLQVMAGAAAFILGFTESLGLMLLCFVMVGVNFGISFFIAMSYSLADPVHKHRRAATSEGILGAGCFAGSIGFGYLAGHFGVTMPFLYMPLLVAAGLALQWGLLRRGRQKVAATNVNQSAEQEA